MNEPLTSWPESRVVGDDLAQRLPNAHGDATLDLAVRQRRIEHVADVLDDRIAHDLHHARLWIDLDLDHVAAVGKGDGGRHELGGFGEANRILALRMARHIREPDRVIGPLERKAAVCKADIVWLGLQHLGSKRTARGDHLLERLAALRFLRPPLRPSRRCRAHRGGRRYHRPR